MKPSRTHEMTLHQDPIKRRGLMLILSSPSGAGKTTLTRDLLQDTSLDLTLSISVTTRPRRTTCTTVPASLPGASTCATA